MLNKPTSNFKIQYIAYLAPFVLYLPILLSGKAIYWGTPYLQFVPWWTQAWRMIQSGELPLWNPMLGLGAPLFANYQSALLYPPTWLYFIAAALKGVAGIAWAQAFSVLLHLLLATWGMLRLSKQLSFSSFAQTIAALAFACSGYVLSRAHFLSMLSTLAWVPWVLYWATLLIQSTNRWRPAVRLSACLGLQLLAGHAQLSWYTILLASAWVVYLAWQTGETAALWKAIKRWLLVGAGAAALAAVQLLPTLEYLSQSQRASSYTYSQAMTYSFWPWRLLGLFMPGFFGTPAQGDYWGYGAYYEDAIYVGLIAILLALFTLKPRLRQEKKPLLAFLWGLVVVSVLLALGDNTPVFPWLYRNIPSFNMFQAPTRFTIIAVVAFSLLAGLGAKHWQRPTGRGLYWSRLAVMGAAAVCLTGAGAWLYSQQLPEAWAARVSMPKSLFFTGLILILLALLNLKAPVEPKLGNINRWHYLVVLVLAADVLLASWGMNPTAPIHDLYPPIESEQQNSIGSELYYLPLSDEQSLKFSKLLSFESFEISGGFTGLQASLLPNSGLLTQRRFVNNFDPLVPARYALWMETLNEAPEDSQTAMLSRMAVSNIVQLQEARSQPVSLSPFEQGLAVVRWVPCAITAQSPEEALAMVMSANYEAEQVLILEGKIQANCDTGQARLYNLESRSNRMRLNLTAESPGYVFIAQSYYPGWQAWVDGERVDLLRADYLFNAVQLSAGEHQLELVYRPTSVYIGASISLLAILFWLYVLKLDPKRVSSKK